MEEQTKYYLLSKLNPENYGLFLYPTEQCNFRCSYCYEDFEIGRMKDDVIQGVKELIARNATKIKNLNLSWFGGEPLLAKNIIEDISTHAIACCDEQGVNLTANMTTNGYLLDVAMMEKMIGLRVRDYQISLDGKDEGHDKTRKLANGGGTYEKIMRNLLALKGTAYDFTIMLRMHVTRANYDSIVELLKFSRDNLLNDKRFSILIKPIGDYGGPNSEKIVKEIAVKQETNLVDMIDTLYAVAGIEAGWNTEDTPKSRPYVCYAALPNSYAIRADGRVQKCTVALNSDSNTLGTISRDGSLSIDNEKLKKWLRGFEYGNLSELKCPNQNFPKEEIGGENLIQYVSVT